MSINDKNDKPKAEKTPRKPRTRKTTVQPAIGVIGTTEAAPKKRRPSTSKTTAKVTAAIGTTETAPKKRRPSTRKPKAEGEAKPARRRPQTFKADSPFVRETPDVFAGELAAPQPPPAYETEITNTSFVPPGDEASTSTPDDRWAKVQSAGEVAIKSAAKAAGTALDFLDESHDNLSRVGRRKGWHEAVDAYHAAHKSVMPTLRDLVSTAEEASRAALTKATDFGRKQSSKATKLW